MNTIMLERFKFIAHQIVGDYAFIENAQIVEHNVMLQGMAYSLKAEVFGEHLKRAEVTYPQTWRDAVKERLYLWLGSGWEGPGHWPWFGDYCRMRWPITYHTVKIDVLALYPDVSVPHARHVLYVARDEESRTGAAYQEDENGD